MNIRARIFFKAATDGDGIHLHMHCHTPLHLYTDTHSTLHTRLLIYVYTDLINCDVLYMHYERHSLYSNKGSLDKRAVPHLWAVPSPASVSRGGVWRRLMKVLSCRIGLMALGFTPSPRWQWEHSAIILSLSLLFFSDHSWVEVL